MVPARVADRAAHVAPIHALTFEPSPVLACQRADGADDVTWFRRLPVIEHLAQPAVLVEVAAEKAPRREVMRVQDDRPRVEDLREAGLDQLAAEQLVLGVGNRPEGNLFPRPAGEHEVDAREERQLPRLRAVGGEPLRGAVEALDVDRDSRAPVLEVALHLGLDHVARVLAGDVRPEDRGDVVGPLEALEERGEPAFVGGRRILRQKRDVVSSSELHHQVARAAVRELRLRDLVHAGAVALCDLERAVL